MAGKLGEGDAAPEETAGYKGDKMIVCKRVYEAADPEDGRRILVDRLWPRGMRKDALIHDDWLPALAPSAELRKAFGHDPQQFDAFREAYRRELAAHPEHWWPLLDHVRKGRVTLLYAARDEQHNNAVVLAEFLEDELERQAPGSSPPCYAGEVGQT